MSKGQILACDCGDTQTFAKDAFKLLFPGEKLPPITQTPDFCEFGEWGKYLGAILKSEQKYAYYVAEDGLWDLLKGVQVA